MWQSLLAALPASRGDLAAARAENAELKTRVEGLLDAAGDPDEGVRGPADQRLFRQLVTGGQRLSEGDFSEVQRRRILEMSHVAYALRGEAENLIDLHLDFMIGDGLRPRAKAGEHQEELQEVLDELWTDARNRLDHDHEDLTRSLLLEGELVQPAELSESDGHLETGYLDPLQVTEVLQDARRRDAFLMCGTDDPGIRLRYFVLDSLNPQIEITQLETPTKKGHRYLVVESSFGPGGLPRTVTRPVHGLVFYWAWNRPKRARRGRPELGSVLDWIDAHDELIWSSVDVANITRQLLWHVKDPSIKTGAEAKQKLKDLGLLHPPKNPKTLATNDKVEIERIGADKFPTARGSSEWLAKELGTGIMGAKGMPESWRGSQGDENLAGARAADYVPLRRLRRKQKRLLRCWHRRVEVELELRRRAGQEIPEGQFEITALEVGGKDKSRGAEIVKSVAAAAVQMASVDAARPELLNHVFVQALKEAGFEVPSSAEGLPPQLADASGAGA